MVALDFRGHGLTAHAESYGYEDYESDVLWLLDRLGLERVPLAGHSLGGYVALFAASRSDRIEAVLAIDVKSDWTKGDAELAERSRNAEHRIEPSRALLVERLQRSVAPAEVAADELETLAERSVEQVEGGWRFRWDRRVLAPEPVNPFGFLPHVRCPAHVIAGKRSEIMPPDRARRFAGAIPGATLELADAGHHVELDAPDLVARRIRDLALAYRTR